MKTNKIFKKGFTLTELIVVIAIIGILAAVLIPAITNYISDAKESAAVQNATAMYQEAIAEFDVTSDEYEDVTTHKYYIVQTGKYFVLLKNGAHAGTIQGGKVSEAASTWTTELSLTGESFYVLTNTDDVYSIEELAKAEGATDFTSTAKYENGAKDPATNPAA